MKIPKKLRKLSRADKGDPALRILKLVEEVGEISEAYLCYKGRKSAGGKRQAQLYAELVEEVVDSLVMSMDLLVCFGCTEKKYLRKLIEKKLQKWEDSCKNNPKQTTGVLDGMERVCSN